MKIFCSTLLLCIAALLSAQVRVPGPGGAGTPSSAFVTNQVLGTLRNNFSGDVGITVTVGAAPLVVTSVGRWIVSGNSGTHTVKITTVNEGSTICSGSVDTTLGTPASYMYVPCSGTLSASTNYYVMSTEASSGDQWYDNSDTTITVTADGTSPGSALNGTQNGGAGAAYVPTNFKYHL